MKNKKIIEAFDQMLPEEERHEKNLEQIISRLEAQGFNGEAFLSEEDKRSGTGKNHKTNTSIKMLKRITAVATALIAAIGIMFATNSEALAGVLNWFRHEKEDDPKSYVYEFKDGGATSIQSANGGADNDLVVYLSAEKQPLTFAECMSMFPYVTVARPAGEQTSTESGGLSMQFEVIERIRGEFPESAFTLSINDTEIDYTSGEYLLFLERFENVMNGETSYAAGEIIYLDQKGLFCDSVTDISSTTLEGIISDAKAYAAEHPYKGDVVTNGEYIKSTDLQDIYAGSDCVFTAVVKEIENDSVLDRTTVLLEIQEVYKGNVSEVDGITVPKNAVNIGEEYLFFANRPDDTARFLIVSSQNSIYLPGEVADFLETVK